MSPEAFASDERVVVAVRTAGTLAAAAVVSDCTDYHYDRENDGGTSAAAAVLLLEKNENFVLSSGIDTSRCCWHHQHLHKVDSNAVDDDDTLLSEDYTWMVVADAAAVFSDSDTFY